MKNKNGVTFLMKNVLGIIVGAVCFFLLASVAFGMYGIFAKPAGLEQATINLNKIGDAIDKVQGGEKEVEVILTSPKNWWLTTWPRSNIKLDKCKRDFCVCLCPSISVKDCENNGICKDTSELDGIDLEIKGAVTLKISSNNNKILITKVK